MSLDEQGFLATEIESYVVRNREEHSEWLSLSHAVNRLAQRLVTGFQPDPRSCTSGELIASALFIRVTSNFQGAVLLAERSMEVEAKTLARACVETVFCLTATVDNGDTFVKKMYSDMVARGRSHVRWLRSNPDLVAQFSEDAKDLLEKYQREFDNDLEAWRQINYEILARDSGLLHFYEWYRHLSGRAAHPTMHALGPYLLERGALGARLAWGPECAREIGETLDLLCNFALAAIGIFNRIVRDELANEELRNLSDVFADLVKRSGH